MDIKKAVEIGELVNEIKRKMEYSEDYKADALKALSKLNEVLTSNGCESVKLNEVLNIED